MAESFWATLKTEFYDRRFWPTRAEARREVARWIEIVYNRRRLHSSLDYASPVAFEKAIEHGQVETEEHTDQAQARSEEHTSELQSRGHLVCRLLLANKKKSRL